VSLRLRDVRFTDLPSRLGAGGIRVVWLLLPHRSNLPTASSALVMAIGIFALAALQQMPFPAQLATPFIALVMLIVWTSIALHFLACAMRGALHLHSGDPIQSFAIGTWVAGTAVVAELVRTGLPQWRAVAAVVAVIAVLLWLWYLALVARRLWALIVGRARFGATGTILLSTVSTQSIVILTALLDPRQVPRAAWAVLITLGYLLYVTGLVLIVRRYLRTRGLRLADDWDTTNCIGHGAMAISGLAALVSGTIPVPWIVLAWLWVAGMFVLVESIEIARLVVRVQAYGWRKGVLTYNVSQWARNFTFGMFYAFTLSLATTDGDAAHWLTDLWALILHYGQYGVLALLSIEIALFLARYAGVLARYAGVRAG
jgi:hypothetical protein